jgi:hypothetical protein
VINSIRKVALESSATNAVAIGAQPMERLGIPIAIGINPSIVAKRRPAPLIQWETEEKIPAPAGPGCLFSVYRGKKL